MIIAAPSGSRLPAPAASPGRRSTNVREFARHRASHDFPLIPNLGDARERADMAVDLNTSADGGSAEVEPTATKPARAQVLNDDRWPDRLASAMFAFAFLVCGLDVHFAAEALLQALRRGLDVDDPHRAKSGVRGIAHCDRYRPAAAASGSLVDLRHLVDHPAPDRPDRVTRHWWLTAPDRRSGDHERGIRDPLTGEASVSSPWPTAEPPRRHHLLPGWRRSGLGPGYVVGKQVRRYAGSAHRGPPCRGQDAGRGGAGQKPMWSGLRCGSRSCWT